MHKSKLAGFIIDCRTDDLPAAAGFWSAALGLAVREVPGSEGDTYRKLHDPQGLSIEVQKVDHASRVHLDIETDDIEAEVRRLELLGAVKVGWVKEWYVMEAPTGQRFCVVQVCTPQFAEQAALWP